MVRISLMISLLALYPFTAQSKYIDVDNNENNIENWSKKKTTRIAIKAHMKNFLRWKTILHADAIQRRCYFFHPELS